MSGFCFGISDYKVLYSEYEQLVDAFSWSLSDIKELSYRERKHWVERYLYKLELEYQRQHRQNNQAQTIIGQAIGGIPTFGGVPLR